MEVNDILESGLLELYVLDELSATERATVGSWALQHPEVKAELTAIQSGIENLALSQAIPVRPNLKDAIVSKIENEKLDQIKYSSSNNIEGGVSALKATNNFDSVSSTNTTIPNQHAETINRVIAPTGRSLSVLPWLLCATLAASSFYFFNELNKERTNSQSCELAQRQNAKAYVEADRALNVLRNTTTKTVELKGLKIAPESKVNIYWNAQKAETMLAIVNLPAPPEKMQYQLWAIVDKKPVSAGVLEYSTEMLQFMKGFDKAEAFAVTLEKKGGSDAPTLDKMYVLGTL